jgi:pre-mRNA-splicing factor ATP-dependent RNA helicase DHX38/PRP16
MAGGEHSPKRRRLNDSRASTPRDFKEATPASWVQRSRQQQRDGPHDTFAGPEPDVNEADAAALDRDWYNTAEEGATLGDESHNPFGGAEEVTWADQEREKELLAKKLAARGRVNHKMLQRQQDADAWETNRMLASSVAQTREQFNNLDDDNDETRVHLLIHDLRPPFLDGKTIFTTQKDPVSAVKDPLSDMAVFSRKGSKVVKERRQQKERQKQAQEATKVAGTALGNVMGVKDEDTDSAAPAVAGQEEKPQSNKFSDHFKKKQEGSSDFSNTKTVREQREYLPAFAVRE